MEPAAVPSPQLHVYTGDGKGKTTAAIGLAVRALGGGLRVDFIQFDKGCAGEEHYSERKILRALPGLFFEATGLERVLGEGKFRFTVTEADRAEAQRGLALARRRLIEGDAGLLILDEIITAASRGLLAEDDLLGLIALFKQRRQRELVLTGRGATQRLIDEADLVTEMTCRKHYYQTGLLARRGIEY